MQNPDFKPPYHKHKAKRRGEKKPKNPRGIYRNVNSAYLWVVEKECILLLTASKLYCTSFFFREKGVRVENL
jgi:hypothetical protein